jgi:hypothetical protein
VGYSVLCCMKGRIELHSHLLSTAASSRACLAITTACEGEREGKEEKEEG